MGQAVEAVEPSLDAMEELIRDFPKPYENETVCVVSGNGLSGLPYLEIGTRIMRSVDRERALQDQWLSLENEIRLPSLNPFAIKENAVGHLFLAILAKAGLINPIITTNWDAYIDSAALAVRLNYAQNPCLSSDSEVRFWGGYKSKVVTNEITTRVWKPHGDIRYIHLRCCEGIMTLNPICTIKENQLNTIYPSEEVIHLDCTNEGKDRLTHHILAPNPNPMSRQMFKEEISGANAEIKDAKSGKIKMFLVVGFAGWDYEEIVDPLISQIGNIPVYYITRSDNIKKEKEGKDVPKLWRALKDIPNTVIVEEPRLALLHVLDRLGYFGKYKDFLDKYKGLKIR